MIDHQNGNQQAPYQQLESALKSKQYSKAQSVILNLQKPYDLFNMLSGFFESMIKMEDQDYENWLFLSALSINSIAQLKSYSQLIGGIMNKFLSSSSPKYSLIIIRGLLLRLQKHIFGKFAIISYLYLFTSLLFDPTYQDFLELFKQIPKIVEDIKLECQGEQSSLISKLHGSIIIQTIVSLIRNKRYQQNQKYLQNVIDFGNIILTLLAQIEQKQLNPLLQKQEISNPFVTIPILLLSNFNINILKYRPTIYFTRAFLSEYRLDDSFSSVVYSKHTILLLLINTANNQLSNDVSVAPNFSKIQQDFLVTAINYMCTQFSQLDAEKGRIFICSNFSRIQELIERINIYLGVVNPKDQLYRNITKTFVQMDFLSIESKEKVLRRLIEKHTNVSFKLHLISQYRRLLAGNCLKSIWFRSTPLLFKQIKYLQPNTSIDYIGHIITFAFYWKSSLNKLQNQASFNSTNYMNIDSLLEQFNDKFLALKKGLELRANLLQNEKDQLERNQINVCIFRLAEIIQKASL